ncbi:hypothetical protein B0H17DRAFT_1235569 [Mycena rosella]|uniref:Uncharacterized protein n=1 Tax=Mycena rosella TaxID=1033263 RepID=A0AAD7G8X8_MYCRO|nr:hypothetical protein B0H17DRAFT_1235569 [Mycena rosella]
MTIDVSATRSRRTLMPNQLTSYGQYHKTLAYRGLAGLEKAGPPSITRMVTYNIVGPGLPQALRVLRYPLYDGPDADAIEMAGACPEEDGPSVIMVTEKQRLRANAQVVGKLEDGYNLTPDIQDERPDVEGVTAYRIILYCSVFPGNRYELDEIEALDNQQRTAMLNRYQTDELLELFSVVKFIHGIISGVVDETLSHMVDILLSTGPEGAVLASEDRTYYTHEKHLLAEHVLHSGDDRLFAGYFALAFATIWTRRNVNPPKEGEATSKWVLDTVIGANDTCSDPRVGSQCPAPGGLKLLMSANWERYSLATPATCLKSHLKFNAFIHPPSSLAGHHAPNTPRHSVHGAHSRGQPPCARRLDCRDLRPGWVPPEDCWYGYNCRTQTRKVPHQLGKNASLARSLFSLAGADFGLWVCSIWTCRRAAMRSCMGGTGWMLEV